MKLSAALLAMLAGTPSATAQSTGMAKIMEDEIFPMADTDANSKITKVEFTAFADKIAFCQPDAVGADKTCCDNALGTMTRDEAADYLIGLYDTDSDSALTLAEMKAAAGVRRRLQTADPCLGIMLEVKIKGLFAPEPTAVVDQLANVATVEPAIVDASATVDTSFTVSTAFLAPRDIAKCQSLFATATGVDTSATTAKATKATAARSRRLAASSYTIIIKAYFPDQASADAAAGNTAAMDTFKADLQTQMTAAGVTVDAASIEIAAVVIPGQSELPVGQFASLAMVLGFLGLSCGIASMVSKTKAKKADATGGCFAAGCCSYFAIKGWSGAKLLSAIVLLVACLLLFNQMHTFISALKTIVDGVIGVLSLEGDAISSVTGQMQQYRTTLDQVAAQLDLLPIAAIVPGLLAALLMTMAAVCGIANKGPGYCCAKVPIFLSYLILLVCLVLYVVLTAVSVVMFLPVTQDQVRQVTSICDSAVPSLANTRMQIVDGIAVADGAGMAVDAELRAQVTLLDNAVVYFDTICAALATDLILAIEGLLFPCIFGLAATLWAWFNAFGLCCSEGCCKSPKQGGSAGKVAPA